VTAGLIYQPVTDESYWAEKSRGAWLQDRRLRVSARRHLDESLIATGVPFQGHGDFNEWTKILAAVGPQVAGIRRFGAASLDLAFVAAGRLDGYWERNLQPWDIAAGQIMVREAGGTISDIGGKDDALKTGHVVCGNEYVHGELVKILKPLDK
jgi:myo-inositol-1(or 4)-monophosphatase